ncbi:alpha amylase C-terminal domain-containing protein [Nonlabens marinus]|uniref:alpha amylase C-terminal domain-containing protein n=1 Tax=Nonlabens marinus TaxID=930802 RepID=UPI000698A513|nr:alpha amylase C-terminal domain-containing protein [Nonlabens marinus]
MTRVPRENYSIGLPEAGNYKLLFKSNTTEYGASDFKVKKSFSAQKENWQYHNQCVELDLPPLEGESHLISKFKTHEIFAIHNHITFCVNCFGSNEFIRTFRGGT